MADSDSGKSLTKKLQSEKGSSKRTQKRDIDRHKRRISKSDSSDDEYIKPTKKHETKHKKHKEIKEEALSSDEKNSHAVYSKEEERLKQKLLDRKRRSDERKQKDNDSADDSKKKNYKEPRSRDRNGSPSRNINKKKTDEQEKYSKRKAEKYSTSGSHHNSHSKDSREDNDRKIYSNKWDERGNNRSRNWDNRIDETTNRSANNINTNNNNLRNRDRHPENNTREWDRGRKHEDENMAGDFGRSETTETIENKPAEEKEEPNFALSGKLTEYTNTYNGVVIKYNEPLEARKPKTKWRLYPFKGDRALPLLQLHRQSAFLLGRDRKIADIPVDHPSCSSQHAVLQFRLVEYERLDGMMGKKVKPYIIDLESTNGTFVNNNKVEARRYVELIEKDVIKFGFSSREYVILHEKSKKEEQDDDQGGSGSESEKEEKDE